MPRSVKISIIGAGSGVFSLGLVKDLCLTDNLRESEVCFMDLNPERLDIVHGLAVRYAEELGSRLRFQKTQDREVALQDANFVINTASAKTHQAQRRERELNRRTRLLLQRRQPPRAVGKLRPDAVGCARCGARLPARLDDPVRQSGLRRFHPAAP
jgi:hypothetical protein